MTLTGFGLLLLAALLTGPLIGSTHISLARVFDRSIPFADNADAQIFFIARLPRVLAAALVGASLAAAGVVFQALLRNPLATPDTLGVSSGAALGAMLAITFHFDFAIAGIASVPLASFAGSIGALGIVYALASARRRGLSTIVLLLAGVTMTAFFQALILFTQYLADFADTFRTVRWLMGTLDVGSYAPILAALPIVADRVRDAGDAAARARSDQPRRRRGGGARRQRAGGRAAGAGQRVAGDGRGGVAGRTGGFIGLVVPHLVRLVVGSDHRLVLPASALFGAAFLIGCDAWRARSWSSGEMPVGIVTALIGGPFFLWLLVRK